MHAGEPAPHKPPCDCTLLPRDPNQEPSGDRLPHTAVRRLHRLKQESEFTIGVLELVLRVGGFGDSIELRRVLLAVLVVCVTLAVEAVRRKRSRHRPLIRIYYTSDSECCYLFPPYRAPGGLRQFVFGDPSCINYREQIVESPVGKSTMLPRRNNFGKNRSSSFSSDDSRPDDDDKKGLEPPVLVYHESARDIVFRDQIRRCNRASSTLSNTSVESEQEPDGVVIANFQPIITPLPSLELGQNDKFQALESAHASEEWTEAEREVVQLLKEERAVVKTIKNAEWTSFLHRFRTAQKIKRGHHNSHADIPPQNSAYRFNSFVTSTSLLPEMGKKMRCFGSTKEYTTGVVFALPKTFNGAETEDEVAARTHTWSWPSGYAAKTEFNIDRCGNLINGRKEAIVPISGLRKRNDDYLHKKDYEIAGKLVKGGLNTVPYNEVYVRVGGVARIVNGKDCGTGEERSEKDGTGRSLEKGLGLPVALFVRTSCYGHLISLLRTRARISSNLGQSNFQGIPLLLVTPEGGVRVLTEKLQEQMLKTVSRNLNPFQNPSLAYKTTMETTSEEHMQQKLEELLDLDSDNIRETLTPEERARLAGGFGATDDSVASLLMEAMQQDQVSNADDVGGGGHTLQDIVNEGLAAAVRSGDYHTSRQLLILYTLVASKEHQKGQQQKTREDTSAHDSEEKKEASIKALPSLTNLAELDDTTEGNTGTVSTLTSQLYTPPPPPPPLDTDRLRSATNSDGLLAVLGAAEVLKAMQDGSAKRRVEEAVLAIEEWIEHGEQSVAFRLASWRDQRAAQTDLRIAMEDDSQFLAFVSNKATTNRKRFASQLRTLVAATDFQDISFLKSIHHIVSQMHSPCLRLELLQYVLGLDNRYSVAHLARSVELAATCLSISTDAVDGDKPAALLTNA